MKKYLAVLFLIVFVVPSIAFASWWNPFSWFKKEVKTEVPVVQKEIPQSETTPIITTQTTQKQSVTSKDSNTTKTKKKVIPVKTNTTIQNENPVTVNTNTAPKVSPAVPKQVTPTPIIVNITTPAPTVIIQTPPTIVTPTIPTPTAPTYTITKNGEAVKSNISLEEVRDFTASLNNYVLWRKNAQSATIQELKDNMLTPNGYALTQN